MQNKKIFLFLIISTFILFNVLIIDGQVKSGLDMLSGEQSLSLESYIVGEGANNFFGSAISTEGDFNGDGIKDIIIGANGAGKNKEGKVYIFYGKKFPKFLSASNADVIISGENKEDSFGWSILCESDFNNDGCDDLLIGAILADEGFENTGAVYLFYGKELSGLINASKADKKFIGSRKNNLFGWSISSGGDINNDGKNDIVIGAIGDSKDKDAILAGGVHIFFNKEFKNVTEADSADVIISGEKPFCYTGNSVSLKGDVNGDGIDDLLVGAFFCDLDAYRGGRAYVFYGKKEFKKDISASDADLIIQPDGLNDWVGSKVLTITDINGDGLSDFVVSAPGKYTERQYSGVVYIFYGADRKGKINITKADLILKGDPVGRKFGSYISSMGDIDLDGKTDLIISQPGGEGNPKEMENKGSVFFFLTSRLKEEDKTIYGFKISGPNPDSNFGNCLSLNDVDGDGVKEVIICSHYDNPNGDKSGAVFIYQWLIKRDKR